MSLSAMPLDVDIADRIMTFSPSFSTLQSTILVSKAFYSDFQSHPMSIIRAVTYNIVGPALPEALRVVRYPYHEHQEDQSTPMEDLDPDIMTAACTEARSELDELENINSLTQKDRSSKTSVLTPEESWRFRRAAYRIILHCKVFPRIRYTLDELVDLENDTVQHIQRQRTALLSTYPTDELLQLYVIARFMRETIVALVNDEDLSADIIDTILTTGPDGVTRAWESRSIDDLEDELHWLFSESDDGNTLKIGYFAGPFANIWAAREVEPPKDDESTNKYILDPVIGANDTCSQCATPGGLKLLTEATGWIPPENCWYGYNCKTMVHKQSHALGKNHLCVPIKGDA
ncbi:hypothetical protein DFH09DRAFT_1301359 [Mycena vulgaris]|nr:hypothetical protein DFH09DRAFT_1301359 [Mycena vulgaris]